ncbi:MAG: hypothetical protein AAB074_23620 [Planctomycetota bacterium]
MLRPFALTFILVSGALAQETFTPRFEDGDVWTEVTSAKLTLRLKVTEVEDGVDGAAHDRTSAVFREERRETTILEATRDTPAAFRMSWPLSRTREGAPDAASTPTALEGQSVEIRGRDATPADAPEAVKSAAREAAPWRALLPTSPKSAGDSWKIPAAALARVLVRGAREEPGDTSEIKITLASVAEGDGARVATLALTGSIGVDSRQDFRVQFDVKGELLWDLSSGHPVSLAMTGEAKSLEGKVKDEKGEVVGKIAGEGSAFEIRVGYAVK